MKNIFKSKRNILIMMFALVVIMGIGFAAYSQQLQIKDTSSIDSDWNVYIKDVSVPDKSSSATGSGAVDETTNLKANLTTDLKYPGDYVIYKLIVANDGNIDAVLEKINFSMQKEGTVIKYYYSVDDKNTWNEVSKNGENPYNEDLLSKTTDDFYVKVEYDPTKTGTATEDQKSNTLTLEFIYAQKTGSGVVPSVPTAAEMLKEKVTTTGDGLYEDEYEEGRHVYKGANPNNYITFNEENDGVAGWRILSVEENNSVKLIKNTGLDYKAWDTNNIKDWNSASINAELNQTYYNSLSASAKNLIITYRWGVGGIMANTDMNRLIAAENGPKWDGNIALIKPSEYIRTNSNKELCGSLALNSTNYRSCTSTSWIRQQLLTLSVNTGNNSTTVWVIESGGGQLSTTQINFGMYTALPALYLTPDITLSGSGTQDDPYTINS